MKHIAKILSIIAMLLTILLGIMQIKDRFMPAAPQATLKVGEYELGSEQIAFHYLIPPKDEHTGVILPFPVVISNDNDVDIKKFFLHIESEVKWFKLPDGTDDCQPRLHDRTTKIPKDNGIEFNLEIPRIGNDIQYFDNSENMAILSEGQALTDYVFLSANYNSLPQQPSDSFDVDMIFSSKGVSERSCHIKVYCYYAEDMAKTMQSIAKTANHKVENYIIHLSFEKYMTIVRPNDPNYSDTRTVYIVSKDAKSIVKL